MAKLTASRGRVNRLVLLMAVCAGSAILGLVMRDLRVATAKGRPQVPARSDEKEILRYDAGNEPVELGNFRVKHMNVAPGRKFSARLLSQTSGDPSEDWLRDLEVDIRNVSEKRITFILLKLHFPEATVNNARMVYQLELGADPALPARAVRDVRAFALEPGAIFTLTLSDNELQKIKDFLALEKFQLIDLNQLGIVLGPVVFDDGMKWEMRHFYKPNARVPGGYERVNPR